MTDHNIEIYIEGCNTNTLLVFINAINKNYTYIGIYNNVIAKDTVNNDKNILHNILLLHTFTQQLFCL